jgi:5-methylcytosine-specific restriction protein A
MKVFKHVKDVLQGKTSMAKPRSNEWPKVRKEHLAKWPLCAVCNGETKLEVHHKNPFHLEPRLELDPNNLITLCESKHDGINCHLLFGHLGSFKSFNKHVSADSSIWNQKILKRPKGESEK